MAYSIHLTHSTVQNQRHLTSRDIKTPSTITLASFTRYNTNSGNHEYTWSLIDVICEYGSLEHIPRSMGIINRYLLYKSRSFNFLSFWRFCCPRSKAIFNYSHCANALHPYLAIFPFDRLSYHHRWQITSLDVNANSFIVKASIFPGNIMLGAGP